MSIADIDGICRLSRVTTVMLPTLLAVSTLTLEWQSAILILEPVGTGWYMYTEAQSIYIC